MQRDLQKRQPERRGARLAKKSQTLSPLYCRANGFLLGVFQALSRYNFARAEFHIHRRRMVEFLEEAEIGLQIPKTHRAYEKAADQVMTRLLKATAARSPELGDFTFLGGACCIDALIRLAGQSPPDELREAAVERMNKRGLDGERLYERFLVDVRLATEDAPDSDIHIQSVLTPALAMLVKMIEPLQVEEETCFVAMPFKPPFSGYFGRLYPGQHPQRPVAVDVLATGARLASCDAVSLRGASGLDGVQSRTCGAPRSHG
jgi:hypothetical protein